MDTLDALFEVSWEVGHKVGGIHTSIATKARSLVERLGERYVAIGPWLLSEKGSDTMLEPAPGFEAFSESCRDAGVPVRVGRWQIPGRPRTILVEFSGLYAQKDQVLGEGLSKVKHGAAAPLEDPQVASGHVRAGRPSLRGHPGCWSGAGAVRVPVAAKALGSDGGARREVGCSRTHPPRVRTARRTAAARRIVPAGQGASCSALSPGSTDLARGH